MDRTLNPVKRGNKRHKARNYNAWRLFSPDGTKCRFCEHDHTTHLSASGQPHFFRPATQEELSNPSEVLYSHILPGPREILVKRITVSKQAELITAYCTACAEAKNTSQVLCYQRTLAKGEVIGIPPDSPD